MEWSYVFRVRFGRHRRTAFVDHGFRERYGLRIYIAFLLRVRA
jgi:hypothetical protein